MIKKIGFLLLAVLLCFSVFSGCRKNTDNERIVIRDPSDTDDFRMNEMTTLRVGLATDLSLYPPGTDPDNNPLYDLFRSAMNINVVNEFALTGLAYEQQITNRIITGKIPDLFRVTEKMLDELIRNDLIINVRPYYEQWATDDLRGIIEYNNGINLQYPTRNGKLYAIPGVMDASTNPIVWTRLDWINALNARTLPAGKTKFAGDKRYNAEGPKSLAEMWDLAEAFAFENPDGSGKKTYGLSVSNTLGPEMLPIFNAYGAYPYTYLQKDGKFDYLGIKDDMLKPLNKLRDLVSRGVVNSDGINIDPMGARIRAGIGECGMLIAHFYAPLLEISNVYSDKPGGGDWVASPLYAAEGAVNNNGLCKREIGTNTNGYYVISKKCANPEAVIKILNNQASLDPENAYKIGNAEICRLYKLTNNWTPISADRHNMNLMRYGWFKKAVDAYYETGEFDDDAVPLDEDKYNYYRIKNYILGDRSKENWMWWASYFQGVKASAMYNDENGFEDGMRNEWNYSPTPTMISKFTRIENILAQTRNQYIYDMTKNTTTLWANCVADWKSGGGTQMLSEMDAFIKTLK